MKDVCCSLSWRQRRKGSRKGRRQGDHQLAAIEFWRWPPSQSMPRGRQSLPRHGGKGLRKGGARRSPTRCRRCCRRCCHLHRTSSLLVPRRWSSLLVPRHWSLQSGWEVQVWLLSSVPSAASMNSLAARPAYIQLCRLMRSRNWLMMNQSQTLKWSWSCTDQSWMILNKPITDA